MPNPQYPFRCHRTFCGWCGVEVDSKPLLTRRVLNIMENDGPYFLVECDKHHAVSDSLEKKRQDWMNAERAKFETVLAAELPNMTAVFRAELLGEVIPAAKDEKKPTKKRPPGAIPVPEATQ